jgi:hypothetical protein
MLKLNVPQDLLFGIKIRVKFASTSHSKAI